MNSFKLQESSNTCLSDQITPAEYKHAFGNANSLPKYVAVITGNTRTAFDVAGFKPEERERNIISNISTKYGKVIKISKPLLFGATIKASKIDILDTVELEKGRKNKQNDLDKILEEYHVFKFHPTIYEGC